MKNPFAPRKREYVLTATERVHEKMVLGFCMLICLGFFTKIVFF
ncbi:MAG: hypothetical protein AAFQ83_16230 [Bacteroidota bacterium]